MSERPDHYFGLYPAVVSDNQDPDGQGRVEVKLPWSPDPSGAEYAAWARLATTMAGDGRGTWFVPEIGDEVLIGFGGGDPRWPYVVGALWNGKAAAPESMDADNNVRSIVSRSGIRIALDDTDGAVTLTLSTPGGQEITLADGDGTVQVADANGNSIALGSDGITLTAANKLTVSAASIEMDAGSIKLSAAMCQCDGVVKTETIIANSVVGTAYTTGAGNAT